MSVYTVHEPQEPPTNFLRHVDRLVFIKEGFSWAALLTLFVPWLIFHRMWIVLIGFIVAFGVLSGILAALGVGEAAGQMFLLLFALLVAFEANNLRRWELRNKGYQLVGTTSGPNRFECELKFLTHWTAASKPVTIDETHIPGTLQKPEEPTPRTGQSSTGQFDSALQRIKT